MAVDQTLIDEREKKRDDNEREEDMVSEASAWNPSPVRMPAQPTERHSWALRFLDSHDVN